MNERSESTTAVVGSDAHPINRKIPSICSEALLQSDSATMRLLAHASNLFAENK
jgi:hypothetical protein